MQLQFDQFELTQVNSGREGTHFSCTPRLPAVSSVLHCILRPVFKLIIILANLHIQVYLPQLSHAFTFLKRNSDIYANNSYFHNAKAVTSEKRYVATTFLLCNLYLQFVILGTPASKAVET